MNYETYPNIKPTTYVSSEKPLFTLYYREYLRSAYQYCETKSKDDLIIAFLMINLSYENYIAYVVRNVTSSIKIANKEKQRRYQKLIDSKPYSIDFLRFLEQETGITYSSKKRNKLSCLSNKRSESLYNHLKHGYARWSIRGASGQIAATTLEKNLTHRNLNRLKEHYENNKISLENSLLPLDKKSKFFIAGFSIRAMINQNNEMLSDSEKIDI